jgi:uncharacterized protein YaaN involved in tellurite resistance
MKMDLIQFDDVDTLVGMLSSNQEILGNLFNSYQNLISMEVMETQKLMLLKNDLMRINQGQSFAKMRKAFHKMKETMFKGFAKALNTSKAMQNKAKHLNKMQQLMDKKISFLDKLKQKALEQIRERKNYVAQMTQQKLIELQMIIQRLMMLGENSSGMGMPELGMPGLGMLGLGMPPIGMPMMINSIGNVMSIMGMGLM